MNEEIQVNKAEQSEFDPSIAFLDRAYAQHSQFDREKWSGKESYHNQEHIRATANSSDIAFDFAKMGIDPLHLQQDMDRWNKLHSDEPELQVKSLDELQLIFRLAIAEHDQGNISKLVDKGGFKSVTFLDTYRADWASDVTAEDRSMDILDFDLKHDINIKPEDKAKFLALGRHLINETRFMFDHKDPNGEIPFAKAMRVFDQIGNDLFSEDERRVIGLLREQVSENPNATFEPYRFFNFVRNRVGELLNDDEAQRVLLSDVWKKSLPEEDTRFVKGEKMKVIDFLNSLNTPGSEVAA